jgi:glyoxylase-like metal-dependent hydrolase (beta-lactamase superfamily II)
LRAGGTVTLVLADVRILVDTGGPSDREVILSALAEQGLTPDQIDVVICTHGHTDHVGNNNLFPAATFLMGQDRSVGDAFSALDFSGGPCTIAAGVRVQATPGHTSEDISVLVETPEGLVAVTGDLFEDVDDSGEETWVHFSRDPERQRRSRAEILALADFIVPGHGGIFSARR